MKPFVRDSFRFGLTTGLLSFFLGTILTILSTSMLVGVSWGVGILIVLFFVFLGVLFDAVGVAAAASDEVPFRSMASKRVAGARQAIQIVRNAARVSSFCNDVIGDICGIISGTATTYVVLQMMLGLRIAEGTFIHTATAVLVTSLVAALTVGGKAFGKAFAIRYATEIILLVGRFFYIIEKKLKISLFNGKRKKEKHSHPERR